jgi:adenosylcobinamide-phosphate guanylyltransferase
MIGLVMAGGKGTRMNFNDEKLLLVHKKPIILQVVDSLKNSNCFSKVLTITSPNFLRIILTYNFLDDSCI